MMMSLYLLNYRNYLTIRSKRKMLPEYNVVQSNYHDPYWCRRVPLSSLNNKFQGKIVSLLDKSKTVEFTTERPVPQKFERRNITLFTCHLRRGASRKQCGDVLCKIVRVGYELLNKHTEIQSLPTYLGTQ